MPNARKKLDQHWLTNRGLVTLTRCCKATCVPSCYLFLDPISALRPYSQLAKNRLFNHTKARMQEPCNLEVGEIG